ncbi:MAG: hypothetical protein OXE40_11700 [Gammaproteobacteria bacterium]|nr:hypothetical protein [Gammaproteobacteria bacterium]
MTTSKQGMESSLALLLAGAVLSSCMAHEPVRNIGIGTHPNFVSHSKAFYDRLLSGRAWILEGVYHPKYRNIVRGFVFAKDGSRIGCLAYKKRNGDPLWLAQTRVKWEVTQRARQVGAVVRNSYDDGRKTRHLPLFYDPTTGTLAGETVRQEKSGRRYWIRSSNGHVQDSWPRALADACPGLALPPDMAINEKQTSLRMDELRRQDPDAPIRNFPGSHLTAPGRTGLGASRGAPTTTEEEVLAFVKAEHGNVLLSPSGVGYVFVGGQAVSEDSFWMDEVWRLDDEGKLMAYGVSHTETDARGQDWVITEIPGQPEFRYPVGYPFPVLPTGHRHAAFQLTDRLIEASEPVALPWMAAKWRDFVFEEGGRLSAAPVAGGVREEGRWRWTRGRLKVWFAEDETEAPFWTDVADMLGMERPKLWTVGSAISVHPES